MVVGGFQLPTVREVDTKYNQIKKALSHNYQEDEIEKVHSSHFVIRNDTTNIGFYPYTHV